MGIRSGMALAGGAVSTWALTRIFHRPAANFPGKFALSINPQIIAYLRGRLKAGSICVVGTNGKTSVTNLLANSFEAAGFTVICNRTGANLDSGVATALMHSKGADWGVFESDELWLAKVFPQLKSDYVLLLNLFRDQLDRVGEIDHIQQSIASALQSSPSTVLVYNADDPLCQAIADGVENAKVPFGIGEHLGLEQNDVADARICQRCDSMLEYEWRQYGQLGSYKCPNCGFARALPRFSAVDVQMGDTGTTFGLQDGDMQANVDVPFPGAYMVYNALAVCAVGCLAGLSLAAMQQAIDEFDPKNGRLQPYCIDGRSVLLNLAKNPTGFNQNLRIIEAGAGSKAVAFFINDKEADGHDVSWLWDIDFQELANTSDLVAYAGGIRGNDMQVRLKYAGVNAELVDGAGDFLSKVAKASPDAQAYLIANYTALPVVKAELDRLAAAGGADGRCMGSADLPHVAEPSEDICPGCKPNPLAGNVLAGNPLVIVHLFPTLLNLYGDSGNVTVLEQRARWRGFDVDVVRVDHGQTFDFSTADIVFLGGGPDREQHMASLDLLDMADDLRAYVEDDGVLLAICGGYQIIGSEWLLGDETVPGLGLVDFTTKRAEGGSRNRLVGNIALTSPLAARPVIGYENHAGRTYLGEGCQPFGRVAGHHGKGNNDSDKADGVLYRNVVGTYLHGPLLAKNPEVADSLIQRALDRRARKTGVVATELEKLDDSVENAANKCMAERLAVL